MTAQPDRGGSNVLPLTKPSIAYVHVTPDMAQRWLGKNNVNRSLRVAKVNQYARDMAAGRWTITNDAVCFGPNGELLNGQHRLNAVIKSGATTLFAVARNVPVNAMTNMDVGAIRSASDALKFSHYTNTALTAATAKQLLLIEDGRIYKDNKVQSVSPAEILAFLDRSPRVEHSVRSVHAVRTRVDCSPTALATANYLIAGVNGTTLADHFLHQLATRDSEPTGSAIHAIDSRLREIRRNRNLYPIRNFVYLLLKGWDYYARNQSVRALSVTPRGDNEFRLPPVAKWSRGGAA